MSPRFRMPGQWRAKTRREGVLISQNQIVSPPMAYSMARSRPPYPENSDRERAVAMGLLVVHESSAGFVDPGTRRDLLAPTRRVEHLPGASPDDRRPSKNPAPNSSQPRRTDPTTARYSTASTTVALTASRAATPLADRGGAGCIATEATARDVARWRWCRCA